MIDNICIQVGSSVYQQTIGIPMGTDYTPLVVDLFFLTNLSFKVGQPWIANWADATHEKLMS